MKDLTHYGIAKSMKIASNSIPNYIVVSSYRDDDDDPGCTLHYASDDLSAAVAAFKTAINDGYVNVILSHRG